MLESVLVFVAEPDSVRVGRVDPDPLGEPEVVLDVLRVLEDVPDTDELRVAVDVLELEVERVTVGDVV